MGSDWDGLRYVGTVSRINKLTTCLYKMSDRAVCALSPPPSPAVVSARVPVRFPTSSRLALSGASLI
jgi:hypothetical protein